MSASVEKSEKKKKNGFVEELYDWVETFVTALVAVVLIFTFICRIVAVDGQSMMQTLEHRDSLIITNLGDVKAGDIVVFQQIEDNYNAPLIKRVIATEGQTVDLDIDPVTGVLNISVDGKLIDEPYAYYDPARRTYEPFIEFPLTVEKGHVLVLGDNRRNSKDSRSFGTIDERNIMGKVLLRLTPVSKFGKVEPVK